VSEMTPLVLSEADIPTSPWSDSHPDWDLVYFLDWVTALGLLVATLPIMITAALWVAIVDRGNPFFTQIRMGKGLKPYRIFKIRSMFHSGEDARFCEAEDDRILPGGQFLRKTRIDELPQLFNVLCGTMALVGPRPEQLPFVEEFQKSIPNYHLRFLVKPGITGLAQVTQGYVACEDGTRQKLAYDLRFIQMRGLGTWARIVFQTVRVILTGHGAR